PGSLSCQRGELVYTDRYPMRRSTRTMSKKANPPTSAQEVRAKLFQNGRSQAVRLPKAFRFQGDEVNVRRDGDAVILEPIKKRAWPKGYWTRVARLRRDLQIGDVPPLGVGLLDLPANDP